MRVLICEDDNMTLQALEHSIRVEGFETLTAKDGLEARDLVAEEPVDLLVICPILMDLNSLPISEIPLRILYRSLC